MPIDWRNYITSTPEILHGKPCLKETRIPVSLILGYLAAGAEVPNILAEFPDITQEHIAACLDTDSSYHHPVTDVLCPTS